MGTIDNSREVDLLREEIDRLNSVVDNLEEYIDQKNNRINALEETIQRMHSPSANIKAHIECCKRLGFYGDVINDSYLELVRSKQSISNRYLNPEKFAESPTFPYPEVDASLIDAFLRGGATVWCGDGSSTATQLVKAVWEAFRDDAERYKVIKDIGLLKEEDLTWVLLKLKTQPETPVETLDEAIDLLIKERFNQKQK